MKKILALAALVAGFTISSQAQEKGSAERQAKHKEHKEWKNKAKEDLNLSENQKVQIKTLNKDFKAQAEAVKGNKSLSEAQKKEQLKAIHTQRKEKMKAILTAEQQQKIAKHSRKQYKKRNKEGRTK